jgi:hypothetical protein
MASGGLVRLAHAYAACEGLEVEPLIRKAGLTSQDVENSKFPINVKSQIAFLNLGPRWREMNYWDFILRRISIYVRSGCSIM